jgi:Xaa-Pro aminopeptidase
MITPRHGPVAPRHLASSVPAAAGDLVVLNPGAMFAGYEAGLGRTWAVRGGRPGARAGELAGRARQQLDALVAACTPGATGAEIVSAWRAAGGTTSPLPLVHGLGLGAEGPVVSDGVGAGDELPAGAVVAVQVWVGEEGTGGFLERDTVLVAEGGGRPLTAFGRDPSLSGDQPAR